MMTDSCRRPTDPGFLENEAFRELRQFCRDVLDWAASEHLRVAEQRRRDDRQRAENEMRASRTDAQTVRETLEVNADPTVTAAFARYEAAMDRTACRPSVKTSSCIERWYSSVRLRPPSLTSQSSRQVVSSRA